MEGSLVELRRKSTSEAGELIHELCILVEGQMPAVAGESPVADVDDSPIGISSHVDHEVDAPVVIIIIGEATAEDHLTLFAA